jgi:hypothetical protein
MIEAHHRLERRALGIDSNRFGNSMRGGLLAAESPHSENWRQR